jgi:gas vesicle protein
LEVPSFFTPPRHLAIGQESPLDPFILNYNGDANEFAQNLQMIFPASIKTNEQKEEYFFKNLKYYADIFSRPEELIPPPDITGMTKDRVKNILRQYTDEELADAYEITSYNWTSRKDFIDKLAEEARGGARWFYRKKRCANENTVNIATGGIGRERDDPTDPIISYGTMKDYRCYNISELELSFRETEVGFQFAVPDWVQGQTMQNFPIESIRQLRQMLVEANNPDLYGELIKKIDDGFAQMNDAGRRLRTLKSQYDAFPDDKKEKVRDYLAWLFLYAMTMRFWQGPGRIYPVIWKEGGGQTGAGGDYCDLATRDDNVIYMQNVRTAILNAMPRDLEEWVLQLPRVRYNFNTGEPTLGQETIDFVIQEIIKGNFCLADASDKTGQTAYYLITRLFSMDDAELNRFIKEEIPRIYQLYEIPMEKATIDSIIKALEKKETGETEKKTLKQQTDRLKKLLEKLYEKAPPVETANKAAILQQAKGIVRNLPTLQAQKLTRVQAQARAQPNFNPGGMTLTYHTDPHVRLHDVGQ